MTPKKESTPLRPMVKLYAELTPEQQAEAERNLRRYAALLWKLAARLAHEREQPPRT